MDGHARAEYWSSKAGEEVEQRGDTLRRRRHSRRSDPEPELRLDLDFVRGATVRRRPGQADQSRLRPRTMSIRYATPVNVPLLTTAVFSMFITAYVVMMFLAVDP